MLPPDHPLAQFNKYYYLNSVSDRNMLFVYMYKFGSEGVLIELRFKDKVSGIGPRGKIFPVVFTSDYDFNLSDGYRQVEANSFDEIYAKIVDILKGMVSRYERQT